MNADVFDHKNICCAEVTPPLFTNLKLSVWREIQILIIFPLCRMLKSQVFTMLIVTSIITHVQETILPYLLKRPSPRRMMNKIAKRVHLDGKFRKKCLHGEVEHIDCLQPNDQVCTVVCISLETRSVAKQVSVAVGWVKIKIS